MAETMREIMNPGLHAGGQPGFPYAPVDWTEELARKQAKSEGIELTEDHWELLRALQGYITRQERVHPRKLHDALEEKFHSKGGLKYLYGLFPKGPIAQGCRLAGLEVPTGAIDESLGSVE
jgi:tRNA 2-thiouridine synthesizing protein E